MRYAFYFLKARLSLTELKYGPPYSRERAILPGMRGLERIFPSPKGCG